MKITKIGHCCLLIEEAGLRILTDPGTYSTKQEEERDVDYILITHEHPDHIHVDSLKKVLHNNPEAKVITNSAVAKLLDEADVNYELIVDQETKKIGEITVQAYESQHAEIHREWPKVINTGLLIADKLFYPGDAFIDPKREINILALPVVGPWMKIGEAIDYAIHLKPKHAFPVHDGILKNPGIVHKPSATILPKHGINFDVLLEGESKEY